MMDRMNVPDRIMQSNFWKVLSRLQLFVMLVASIIMLAILGIVVFMRYTVHKDFFGYDELLLVDSFWMYFIGAAYAMNTESHVKADIFATFCGPYLQALMKILAGIFQIAMQFVFDVFAFNMIYRAYTTWPTTSSWSIPFLFPQFSIFLGFIIITFYLLVFLWRDINSFNALRKGRA